MKRSSFFCVFFITSIISCDIFAQIETLQQLSYLPLNMGNKWQYRVIVGVEGNNDTTYSIYQVTGDTLMPNQKVYIKLESDVEYRNYYFRVDSTTLKVYRYTPYPYNCPDSEIVYFDLSPPSGGVYNTCENYQVQSNAGFGSVGLLNIQRNYLFYEWSYLEFTQYTLSEEIGISSWYFLELAYSVGSLVAAEINGVTYGNFVGISDVELTFPNQFHLSPNFPNPFNSETIISYSLQIGGHTNLVVYDVLGKRVSTLVDEYKIPGDYKVRWRGIDEKGSEAPSGIYFALLLFKSYSKQIQKMVVIR